MQQTTPHGTLARISYNEYKLLLHFVECKIPYFAQKNEGLFFYSKRKKEEGWTKSITQFGSNSIKMRINKNQEKKNLNKIKIWMTKKIKKRNRSRIYFSWK